jgi:hypothetical protein
MENINFYDGSTFHLSRAEHVALVRKYPKAYFLQTVNMHWRDMLLEEAIPDWLESMKNEGAYVDFMFALDHMLQNPYPDLCQDLHHWGWFELFHEREGEDFATFFTTDECLEWLRNFKETLVAVYEGRNQ